MKLFSSQTQRNAKLLQCVALGMMLVFFGAAIFMTDPAKLIVDWQVSLKENTLLYNLYLLPPIDVYIKVFMFNYTNVEDFVAGRDAKIKVEEVGPYVYQEVLSNHNITINESNNTITFTPRREYVFIRELSVGEPKLDRIRAPNIPYMGASTLAASMSIFAALGLSALATRLNAQALLNVTVHDYLWGYEDHLVHLASKFVPSLINFPRFGLMEQLFREGNESNVFNMHLPERKDAYGVNLPGQPRAYSLHSVNGERGFHRWEYNEATNGTQCNRIWGSHDVTVFPRDMNEHDTFFMFRRTFCRTLPMKYRGSTSYKGLDAKEFGLDPDVFDSDLHNVNSSCFCKNNKCLKRGVGSVAPCYYTMPLAITYPHFLHADPSLLEPFEGLKPDEKRYKSSIMLQPQLGVPMHAKIALQANQVVGTVKFNREMAAFENMVLPLLRIDLTIENLPWGLQLLAHGIKYGFAVLQGILSLCLVLFGFHQLSVALMLGFGSPPAVPIRSEHEEKFRSARLGSLTLHKAPHPVEEQQLLWEVDTKRLDGV